MNDIVSKLEKLLVEKFQEEDFQDVFLVEIKTNTDGKKVFVFVDSDTNLTISTCTRLSRYLEHHIDENGWLGEKYTIEVSSPGVGTPLKSIRQYKKNIGRLVNVKVKDEHKHVEGTLTTVDDEKILIVFSEKRRIEGRKKKELVEIREEIALEHIEKIVVKIVF